MDVGSSGSASGHTYLPGTASLVQEIDSELSGRINVQYTVSCLLL